MGVVTEDLQAQQDLARTQEAYLSAVAEFDKVQYALLRAVGGIGAPPREPAPQPAGTTPPAESATK